MLRYRSISMFHIPLDEEYRLNGIRKRESGCSVQKWSYLGKSGSILDPRMPFENTESDLVRENMTSFRPVKHLEESRTMEENRPASDSIHFAI